MNGPEDFQKQTGCSDAALTRLRIYAERLEKWQKAINLVAPKTLPELWQRHFFDSAQLLKHAPQGVTRWLDLGSGGGFPGLVVAALSEASVHLVESDQRKSAFLRDTAHAMGVKAMVHVKRIEAVEPDALHHVMGGAPQVISARALAPLKDLIDLAHPLAGPDTVFLFLKGRQAEDELTEAQRYWTLRSPDLLPSLTEAEARIIRFATPDPA